MDNRLNTVRSKVLDKVDLKDKYDFVKLDSKADFLNLRRQFVHGPYLQLVSERSRPEAFIDRSAPEDFAHTDPGIVDIKIVKAGIIYRLEESSKLGLYSTKVWKEWGAILTASQLYLFKDVAWVKASLLSQDNGGKFPQSFSDSHTLGNSIIRVPIDGFTPSVVVPTKNMIALTSELSDRNKHSFFVGSESKDWFAAESQEEMRDWILKINYAASFNTYHIGIHGISNSRDDLRLSKNRRQASGTSLVDLGKVTSDLSFDFREDDRDKEKEETEKEKEVDEEAAAAVEDDEDKTFSNTLSNFNLNETLYASTKHRERVIAVKRKIDKIEKVLEEKEKDLEKDIRSTRHLKLLAPLQPKTREAVSAAARRLLGKLDTSFINRKRLQCYHSLFELELQVESDFCAELGIEINDDDDDEAGPVAGSNSDNEQNEEAKDNGSILSNESRRSKQSAKATLATKIDSPDDSIVESIDLSSPPPVVSPTKSPSPVSNLKEMLSIPKRSTRRNSTSDYEDNEQSGSEQGNNTNSNNKRSVSLLRKTNDFTLNGKKFTVVEVNPEFAATPNHNRTASQSINNEIASSVATSVNELEPAQSYHSALSTQTQSSTTK